MSKIPYENLEYSCTDSDEEANQTLLDKIEIEEDKNVEDGDLERKPSKEILDKNKSMEDILHKEEDNNSANVKKLHTHSSDSISSPPKSGKVKRRKSDNGFSPFCVATTSNAVSKQPMLHTEARNIWPQLFTNFSFQNDARRWFGMNGFHEIERIRSPHRQSRGYIPLNRRYASSFYHFGMRDPDRDPSIRRFRTKVNSITRKQAELENVISQFSSQIERIYEEFRNNQQNLSDQQANIARQLSDLDSYIKNMNLLETHKQLLVFHRDMYIKIRWFQQQFDKSMQETDRRRQSTLLENNNLMNQIKTMQDENRNLHEALNAERRKLHRMRQLQVHRDGLRESLEDRRESGKQNQQCNKKKCINFNKKTRFVIPLPYKEEDSFGISKHHNDGKASEKGSQNLNEIEMKSINSSDIWNSEVDNEENTSNVCSNKKDCSKIPPRRITEYFTRKYNLEESSSTISKEISNLFEDIMTEENVADQNTKNEKQSFKSDQLLNSSLWMYGINNFNFQKNNFIKDTDNCSKKNEDNSVMEKLEKLNVNETSIWLSDDGNQLDSVFNQQSNSDILQQRVDSNSQQPSKNMANNNPQAVINLNNNEKLPSFFQQCRNKCMSAYNEADDFSRRVGCQNDTCRKYRTKLCFSFAIIGCILLGTLIPVPWRIA